MYGLLTKIRMLAQSEGLGNQAIPYKTFTWLKPNNFL
jgi:hypothetical protein